MTLTENEALWNLLEAESREAGAGGILLRRVHPKSKRNIFFGFRVPDQRRVLLMRIPNTVAPEIRDMATSRGIDLCVSPLPSDPSTDTSLQLTLREPRFADIFTALADDVANRVALAPDDAAGVHAFLTRIRKWQRFLEELSEGLGLEAQRGLWGELHFLRRYLIATRGPGAVAFWVGPAGRPQDFQMQAIAVEVKTTIANQPQSIRISNERQLDGSNGRRLFLVVFALEPVPDPGAGLPSLVNAIRNEISRDAVASECFEDLLLDCGYLDAHAHHYVATGYEIRKTCIFHVIEGFPRIVEAGLPLGIGSVSYSIALSACSGFTATEPDLITVIS